MGSLISVLQCALRVAFALTLGVTAAQEIFAVESAQFGAVSVREPGLVTSLLCIVLAVISIWLILGFSTRAVALLGLGLYLAHELLLPGFDVFDMQVAPSCVLATMLALPLVFFGGGRFSLAPAEGTDRV